MTAKSLACLLLCGFTACSTTEEQVVNHLEQLAANPIDSPRWQQAVDELSAIGRPAARQLIARLNPNLYQGKDYREFREEKEKLRTGSARALGHIKPRGATGALNGCIGTGFTTNERIAALWSLGQVGYTQAGLDAVKGQLTDPDPIIRIHAAIALVKMDVDSGNEEIKAAFAPNDLDTGESSDRIKIALQGLEESGYYGVPLLIDLSEITSPHQAELRTIAGRVKDQLVEQLNAEEPDHRQRAAKALGQLNDQSTTSALVNLLADPSNQVRFSAAAALATMGVAQGIDFLFDALRNTDSILRANAVKFLTNVQQQSGSVETQLGTALDAEDPLARAGAARVLGQARVLSASNALLEATTDEIADVRVNATIALGYIGAEESRSRLEGLREDRDATVSYYAEWALSQLGPR